MPSMPASPGGPRHRGRSGRSRTRSGEIGLDADLALALALADYRPLDHGDDKKCPLERAAPEDIEPTVASLHDGAQALRPRTSPASGVDQPLGHDREVLVVAVAV